MLTSLLQVSDETSLATVSVSRVITLTDTTLSYFR